MSVSEAARPEIAIFLHQEEGKCMNREFRKLTMAHLLKTSGVVTDIVQKTLGIAPTSNFKNEFLKTQPGPARETLVLNELIKRGPPKQLVPVTVPGPAGTKITYHVMPDYVMIDGIRVTMAPATAQKVADHFKMMLPTDKMSRQIYDAADTKVRAAVLSGSGYTGVDGKRYTAKDVVERRIGQSDAALHYNDLTDVEIARARQDGKPAQLIAGHGKDILQPAGNPSDPRIGGWHGADGVALQPYSSPHKGEAANHTEYGLYTRLVSDKVTVTTPDGRTIETTMDKLLNSPQLAQAVTVVPGANRYNVDT